MSNFTARRLWSLLWARRDFARRFPGASVARSARIFGASTVGARSQVGGWCLIGDSKIGADVIVGSEVILIDCVLAGKNQIYEGVNASGSQIGAYTYMGRWTEATNAKVGKFCSIASDVSLSMGDHPTRWLSTHPAFFSTLRQSGSTFAETTSFPELPGCVVGNDVWIGRSARIKGNVKIGDGAVIATNAVVTKDVEPYDIVGGTPARQIRRRLSVTDAERLQRLAWWDWSDEELKLARPWIAQPDVSKLEDWVSQHRGELKKYRHGA